MSQQPAPGVKSAKPKRRTAEIVAAAAKVFARRGYHGASTQDIADVLGIRQASLYYYFESKEAALEAVCTEGMRDYALRAQRIHRSHDSGAATAKPTTIHTNMGFINSHKIWGVFAPFIFRIPISLVLLVIE